MFFIHTEADLEHAIARLVDADPRFGAVLSRAGRPPLRRRPDGFSGLASIVVSQQLSTASAKAIWARLNEAFDPLDHAVILRARAAKFCLGHADAWPAGDLALQEATRLLLALKTRPSVKEMGGLAEAWRPWRGAAACMLWAYYRAAKQRDGAPIAAAMASNG